MIDDRTVKTFVVSLTATYAYTYENRPKVSQRHTTLSYEFSWEVSQTQIDSFWSAAGKVDDGWVLLSVQNTLVILEASIQ